MIWRSNLFYEYDKRLILMIKIFQMNVCMIYILYIYIIWIAILDMNRL